MNSIFVFKTNDASSNRESNEESEPSAVASDETNSTTSAGETENSNSNSRASSARGGAQPAQAATTNGATVHENGVRPKSNEPALPPGWDFSYSDKGRMFFIDHVSKKTTWIDPRTGKPSPQPTLDFESRIGPLPVCILYLT